MLKLHRKSQPNVAHHTTNNDEVESIIKEFKSGNNVTYVNLPKTLIKLGLKAADDETANALAEQIDGLQILTSRRLIKRFETAYTPYQ